MLRGGPILSPVCDAGPVIWPRYRDQPEIPAHPVLLDRVAWLLCRQATGDRGLNDVFAAVAFVDVPGANPDIDTPADLHLFEDRPR